MNRIAIVLATVLAVLAGCNGKDDPGGDGTSKKTLRVATDATWRPFEFVDENQQIVGFEIDLFREVAKRAGYETTFENPGWDALIPGLHAKDYDVLVSSMSITPERAEKVAFSDPYYQVAQVIAVREDRQGIETLDDLKGKSIGAQRGTTGAAKAKEVAGADVKEYETIDLAILDLKNGSIDAVVNDEPATRAIAKEKGGIRLVGVPLTKEEYGFAFRKEDAEVVKKINAALAEVKRDGTYDALRKKWLEGKAE